VASGREPKVAVVGATGAVGNQLVELLETRAFSKGDLTLFASPSGASSTIEIEEDEFDIEELESPESLRPFSLAFLALPSERAAEIISARPGPLLIDLSGASRLPSGQPLVSPGITSRDRLGELRGQMVFEVPHPAAHALAVIFGALEVRSGFAAATLLQGASAGGRDRVTHTVEQSADLLSGSLDIEENEIQHGFNILITERERHIAEVIRAQTVDLMESAPSLSLNVMTAPILHGSVLTIHLPPSDDAAKYAERLKSAPGVLLIEGTEAIGVIDALGQEAIVVRIDRQPGGTAIFAAFDNARLAALIAIWIAENLLLTSH
jgi:aspartate-semialdehyde dehydrogenase